MIIVDDLVAYVEELSGHPLNGDEGVFLGVGDRAVTGVTVCWTPAPEAVRSAGESGHELLIGHESLDFPCINSRKTRTEPQEWKANAQRRQLLENYKLTFLRLHGSLDQICIFDDFAAALGLGEPVSSAEGLVKIYEIPECSLEQLIARVKERLGLRSVRVSAPGGMKRRVRRVGLPWGGVGLFVNLWYQQQLVEEGCDVFIAGESDNYGLRFAAECGIPMIETSHEVSENPGLRRFTQMLAQKFPDLNVCFFENRCVWEMC